MGEREREREVCTPSFKPDVHSRIAATSKQKSRLERRPSSYK